MTEIIVQVLEQNLSIDIHETYFSTYQPPSATNYDSDDDDDQATHTISMFHDKSRLGRSINSISWIPDGCSKVAASYANLKFQGLEFSSLSESHCESYIWDVTNPNDPVYVLSPPSPAVCVEYNPKDVHMVAGGCYNGLVCCWDTRKAGHSVLSSGIESSHRDPVYSVSWLQSKSACEVLSCSTDGRCLVWDVRKLTTPIEEIPIISKGDYSQIDGQVTLSHLDALGHGCVSMCYDIGGGPSKFIVGSEHGQVLLVNRKVKNESERCSIPFDAHLGPVLSIDRSKHFPRYFMSVGDWSAKLWYDDEHVRTPLFSTPFQSSRILSGCWSPLKPGLFMLSRDDGVVDFWDLCIQHSLPVLSLPVLNTALCSMSVANSGAANGRLLGTGSVDGRLALVSLGDDLASSNPSERSFMSNLLEREVKREKSLISKGKDDKEKKKSKNEDIFETEEILQQIEDEYLSQLQKN
ncbi:hypothetical protein GEMRC1_002769 [Eukaryota sp. GEM-RC1]